MGKLNNKGFTLVELLAVVVILVIIMSIALPNISSSIERSNAKQDTAMIDVIESAGGLYVSNHKAEINKNHPGIVNGSGLCYIKVSQLKEDGYFTDKDVEGYSDKCLAYYGKNTFEYSGVNCDSVSETDFCV